MKAVLISIKRFPALYESCLTLDEIVKYAQGEPVYGWQISQLKLYEEPFKLEDFSRHGFCGMNGTGVCGNAYCGKPLKIIGTERFCDNVKCFNRFQNI